VKKRLPDFNFMGALAAPREGSGFLRNATCLEIKRRKKHRKEREEKVGGDRGLQKDLPRKRGEWSSLILWTSEQAEQGGREGLHRGGEEKRSVLPLYSTMAAPSKDCFSRSGSGRGQEEEHKRERNYERRK